MKRYLTLGMAAFAWLVLTTAPTSAQVQESIVPFLDEIESGTALQGAKLHPDQQAEILEGIAQRGDKIRVVTYNMLSSTYESKYDPHYTWPQRLPRILEMIAEMKPDLLCVQEIEPSQYNDLVSAFGESYGAVGTIDNEDQAGTAQPSAIFYNKDRFELRQHRVVYISETPMSPSADPYGNTRTITVASLRDSVTGKKIAVASAHFSFFSLESRVYAARFVSKWLKYLSPMMPVLFCGDLNTFPMRLDLHSLPAYDGDYVHRILVGGGFVDAKDVALLGHVGPLSTYTNGQPDAIPFTGTGTPGVILDHIYVAGKAKVLAHGVQPARVDGFFASDHMPVLADILMIKSKDEPRSNDEPKEQPRSSDKPRISDEQPKDQPRSDDKPKEQSRSDETPRGDDEPKDQPRTNNEDETNESQPSN